MIVATLHFFRHPGESRDPANAPKTWIPAFAGMTSLLQKRGRS